MATSELFVRGPAGRLEALYDEPRGADPVAAAVVCHPNPRQGGTMHNSVVFRLAKGLREAGLATLRFNFRGIGASAGRSEASEVEAEDARACLDHLERLHPGLPLWIAGFSFGARTAALVAEHDARIARVILVALPSRVFDTSAVERVRPPGFVLMAGNDEFGNLSELRANHPSLPPGLELDEVEDTDHFFRRKTPEVQARVRDYALRALDRRSSS